MAAPTELPFLRAPAPRSGTTSPDVADAVHHLERAEAILARRDPMPTALLTELRALRERVVQVLEHQQTPAVDAAPRLARQQELPVSTGAPRLARSFCRDTCDEWGLPAPVVSTVTDLSSELVANAVRHTRSPMRVSLERSPHSIVLSVWDDGMGVPHVLPYRPGISERGIGLHLVKQLSSDWGWAPSDGGKWVWARIPIPGSD